MASSSCLFVLGLPDKEMSAMALGLAHRYMLITYTVYVVVQMEALRYASMNFYFTEV